MIAYHPLAKVLDRRIFSFLSSQFAQLDLGRVSPECIAQKLVIFFRQLPTLLGRQKRYSNRHEQACNQHDS